jgi:dephospho-CoA kinase
MFAITGLIGSGKSLVASVVREAGFEVLDADSLAHELYKEHSGLRKKIAEAFGYEAITENGINRFYISRIIFNDVQKLLLLESIVHPVLQKEIEERNPHFVEVAVLYKWANFAKKMQAIWLVEADESIRRERLLKKGMNERDVESRIKTQARDAQNAEWGTVKIVRIENNGSQEVCIDFTKRLIEEIQYF